MTLAELQSSFRQWLHADELPAFASASLAGLRIYQNNYRAQLADCLGASFPLTRAWIGSAAFHDAVVAHVDRVPPSSWTLDAYPRDFADTLRLRYPADLEVAELASLEHALDETFVGADAEPVSMDAAALVDWDRASLRFAPSLDLLEVRTNSAVIHAALCAGETPPIAAVLPEARAVLVWRHQFQVYCRKIDPSEQRAFLLARSGKCFADLCRALIGEHGQVDGTELAGAYLGRWLADGLIVAIPDD